MPSKRRNRKSSPDGTRSRFAVSSDMTKILGGGWRTAPGNVIGFYFGGRSAAPG